MLVVTHQVGASLVAQKGTKQELTGIDGQDLLVADGQLALNLVLESLLQAFDGSAILAFPH